MSSNDREELYPLELNGDEARYLHEMLKSDYLSLHSGYEISGSILKKLKYSPPVFPVGTRVQRIAAYWEDERVFVVTGHRFVSPGNWTAYLDWNGEDYGGVGEKYLRLEGNKALDL